MISEKFPSMVFWSCLVHQLSILLVMSSFISFVIAGSSAVQQSDRPALHDFKAQIKDDPLGALSNWNNSIHYCEWYGVTCSRRHLNRVTVLDLQSQKLGGTLSSHIGNLSFLKSIILTMNNFHGPIPQEVGQLSRLKIVYLNNNSFDGQIPTNLTHCSSLRIINLSNNKISGIIPVELTSLSSLLIFHVRNNELQGSIPSSLGNLSSLLELDFAKNHFEGHIPGDLCHIHNIEALILEFNNFTGTVPFCLYNLTNMSIFTLAWNQLDGYLPPDIGNNLPNLQEFLAGLNEFQGPIPSSILNASRLEQLDLSSNKFTGQVPSDLGRLYALQILNIEANQLSSTEDLGIFNSLTNCSSLRLLSMGGNSLTGLLPNAVANLSTKLEDLVLGDNQIYGNIPSGIQNLVSLQMLAFEYNGITGGIPAGMGMLYKMQKLHLNGNQLSGEIPDSFGNLTQMLKLNLEQNMLHGKIPPSLGRLKELTGMSLSYNSLNGTIPKQLFDIFPLFALYLSNNALVGPLPSEVGSLENLEYLSIRSNRLVGQIPEILGSCLMLTELYMGNNLFEGKIPPSMSKLTSLQALDLSQNKLSGGIPNYLVKFDILTYLNLSYNEFEGPVPTDGVFRNASLFSVLKNKDLCGGVVELNLPPCHIQCFTKNKHLFHKVVIPAIVASFLLVLMICFLLMLCKQRIFRKRFSSPSLSHHLLPRISYAMLLEATNSFSPDNFIGSGSYGTVYKGSIDQDTTVVAVKVFNLARRGASKSFISECNALRNLRHRNLVKIVTCCSSVDFHGNDFKALVFEFLPNGSLEEWLHPTRDEDRDLRSLTFLQRLNIVIDIASALDYLHNHCQPTIVHCDIKPSNVLLNDDMAAHVADFGLAKIFSVDLSNSSQSQEISLAIKGSIGYAAPEYGMGRPVSVEGDVYSFGIVVLEMLLGKRPTDDMFQNGKNLHSFAKSALQKQGMTLLDPKILLQGYSDFVGDANHCESGVLLHDRQVRTLEGLVSLTKLGLICSDESPAGRMNMGDVLSELYRIKDHHQALGKHQE